ncbi:hypothetical protein C2G38_2191397 [Gigaspora rosea]|uniref:Uncharacterized protein n=1 Tax=Gigaspora rosea TaxID=44941 RepID=A0A397V7D3_9GLOM|nr:hypothetical protein C2G38_2191397 [Gigaspora rosea]
MDYNDQIKISIYDNIRKENLPHEGKEISEIVCSLNMKYVATVSYDDKSVFGWPIIGHFKLNFDHSISFKDLNLNWDLLEVVDCKHIIIRIFDITTRSKQILNVQGVKESIHNATFLENGDLAVVKGDPDLTNLKFETQYILDWNLTKDKDSICMELNNGGTLLAVLGYVSDSNLTRKSAIYVYSKSNITNILFKNSYYIDKMYFIGSKERERLLVYCGSYYIINPYNLSDTINAEELLGINLSDEKNIIISNYIIEVQDDNLQMQCLDQHKKWDDHLCNGGYNKIDTPLCGKEIRQTLQDTLERYKLTQEIIQDFSTKEYTGKLYTWVIDANEFLVEFKLLESEDLMLISSFGVHIWTVSTQYKNNLLYYWVNVDIYERFISKTAREALIEQIIFLSNKYGSKDLLPSSYFDQLIEHSNYLTYRCGSKLNRCSNILDYYMKDISVLKLNGKELICELIRKHKGEQIKDLFKYCLEQSLLQIKNGKITEFIKLIDIITSTLLKLETCDKNFRFTERFLSQTALLISDAFESNLNNFSISSHLEHCGTYVYLPYLLNTSYFDCIFVWISNRWENLKKNYSQFSTYPTENYSTYRELINLPDNPFTSLNIPGYYKW